MGQAGFLGRAAAAALTTAGRDRLRTAELSVMPHRGHVWFALQSGLCVAILVAPFVQRFAAPRLLRVLGSGVLAGGASITVAGYRALGSSHSPWTTPRADGRLVTVGIYRRLRHPIYAGWCVAALGAALLTGSPIGIGLAGVLAVFYDLRSREEERLLAQRYPSYSVYAQHTSKFVPHLY
jgi:protein-S-isoprenylcysteine O-methyltransferase Ste14